MDCETCVVTLTLLVGMGLLDLATPPESRRHRDRWATCFAHSSPGHHLCQPERLASVLVVGLCSWFSFAFSFKTELSPWELVRRAPAGGGAQGTFPMLQGLCLHPAHLFQEICLL